MSAADWLLPRGRGSPPLDFQYLSLWLICVYQYVLLANLYMDVLYLYPQNSVQHI